MSNFVRKLRLKATCCHGGSEKMSEGLEKVAIIGNPNVGKSVIFNALTGRYVTVSNYPGTTVEVSRGKGKFGDRTCEVIDTPGMYSLLPITEEERVARSILLEEQPKVIIQVVDAKNLERMLPLTFQLMEAGFYLVLNLNLMDEAERLGLNIDINTLQDELGIPVIGTTAVEGKNIDKLKELITAKLEKKNLQKKNKIVNYGKDIEEVINKIESLFESEYPISKRSVALLLCTGDKELSSIVKKKEKANWQKIERLLEEVKIKFSQSFLNYILSLKKQKIANIVCEKIVYEKKGKEKPSIKERLSRLTMNPLTGFPLFLLIIFALYEFVGVFGAQIGVDFLEETVFGKYINPFVNKIVSSIIPWKVLQDLFVHEYGIITLGIRYAVAIILPIVATFFIAFSIIEDSGYLPRLAMLIDRGFKKIGLNGRAVIPIVLGFGCDTMATMTTRTLETRRERIIASFLLALAIPCSAQLGVILALLSGNIKALGIWIGVMTLVFILIGYLASRIMPGEKPIFYMEVPPLRWPKLSNVLVKTYTRVEWYFKEVLPLFIYASIFIWIGRITGIFDFIISVLEYPVQWIGLPKESAIAFLFGFFRRDYGAAGLYDLKQAGILTGIPLVVSVVTLSLFVPCIAQFSMNIKERGLKTALLMAGFIFPFAFLMGGLLNLLLNLLGVKL
jgi:ferrous iron transport protein B